MQSVKSDQKSTKKNKKEEDLQQKYINEKDTTRRKFWKDMLIKLGYKVPKL